MGMQTRHDVMVPLGAMAFMPGELVHTNEIMVLLGDNYFAERSGTQATHIMQRRIDVIDDIIRRTDKKIKDLAARDTFSHEARKVNSSLSPPARKHATEGHSEGERHALNKPGNARTGGRARGPADEAAKGRLYRLLPPLAFLRCVPSSPPKRSSWFHVITPSLSVSLMFFWCPTRHRPCLRRWAWTPVQRHLQLCRFLSKLKSGQTRTTTKRGW